MTAFDDRKDLALIEEARNGNRRAFTTLVRRYENTVYGFAYNVCRDKEKAAETLQDTFINVFRKLDSFDGRSKFSTWLYTIVTNNCLMKRRRRKTDDVLESLDETSDGESGKGTGQFARWDKTPADVLEQKEMRTIIDRAILKLPVDYRVVFILRDVEEKSNEETAQILGISLEATKSRLRRARAFLRRELDPYMRADSA